MYMKRIVIVGSGWYGCHTYMLLHDKHKVTMIEQGSDIFGKSSYYNQNRLHLGYHYCRDYATRKLCKDNYDVFLERYGSLVCDVENNFYAMGMRIIYCLI
ncbi:FAD-binding oxidoreductase [Yasminevirus sp. GU-2018]|uniref:FAD-binding oxidoreductase n=1 Tax=Yasminevirus sp. GU-2018 TaxID=2420051 RepID=A0A5K0UCE4_9VIRU|nr:FAD-binding oxidoreductase [Yasminevirus sp. GU-2018]